jgi:hypothetical protein
MNFVLLRDIANLIRSILRISNIVCRLFPVTSVVIPKSKRINVLFLFELGKLSQLLNLSSCYFRYLSDSLLATSSTIVLLVQQEFGNACYEFRN